MDECDDCDGQGGVGDDVRRKGSADE